MFSCFLPFLFSLDWVRSRWKLSQNRQKQWESYWSTFSRGEMHWSSTTRNLSRRTEGWAASSNASLQSKYTHKTSKTSRWSRGGSYHIGKRQRFHQFLMKVAENFTRLSKPDMAETDKKTFKVAFRCIHHLLLIIYSILYLNTGFLYLSEYFLHTAGLDASWIHCTRHMFWYLASQRQLC